MTTMIKLLVLVLLLATICPTTDAATLEEIILGNPDLALLVSLWNKSGMTFSPSEIGTIFAPDNAAIEAFEGTWDDPEQAISILLYHVIGGRVYRSDTLVTRTRLETALQGQELTIQATGNNGTEFTINGGVKVKQADILADNGVVHIIDQVLVPPDMEIETTETIETTTETTSEIEDTTGNNNNGPATAAYREGSGATSTGLVSVAFLSMMGALTTQFL